MENSVPKISSNLSKMWNKIVNLENSFFLILKIDRFLHDRTLRILCEWRYKVTSKGRFDKLFNTQSIKRGVKISTMKN